MSRSNLTDAVAAIDRCSADELRQLNALITVRLGETIPGKARGGTGKQVGGGKGGKTSQGKAQKPARNPKGNPQRKSQYATHPVYKAYRVAKIALEKEAKESKTLFKDLSGNSRDIYDAALMAWLQTKSGFRNSKKDDENPDSKSEEASHDGEGGGESNALVAASPKEAPKGAPKDGPGPPRKRPRSSGGSKYKDPPDSWNPEDGVEWSTLNRQSRKDAYKASGGSSVHSEDKMDQDG
jgi:hypothetical protein